MKEIKDIGNKSKEGKNQNMNKILLRKSDIGGRLSLSSDLQ